MAVCCSRVSFTLYRRAISCFLPPGTRGGVSTSLWLSGQDRRQLYTPAALGLDQYVRLRRDTSVRFTNIGDTLKTRMSELLAKKDNAMIFTEDFKNVLHLAEATEEDLAMIREMACRFNQQHQGLRFGMYVFGPVVMRTYHTLWQPQEALQALQDPRLSGFFDQLVSYQVLMDLLYKAERYEEVLQVFEEVQEKRITGVRYPKNCLYLAIAACYKMASQDSLTHLQGLLDKMQEYGITLNRKLVGMSAGLALAVGYPHTALDLVLHSTSVTHIVIRSIKVLSLCQLGRVEEAVLTLRAITEIDLPGPARSNKGVYILREAVSAVEAAVEEGGRKEQQVEAMRIIKCLEEAAAISQKGLDELVCQPIDKFERQPGQDRAMLAASFSNTPSQAGRAHRRGGHLSAASRAPKRQGLMDME